MGAQTIAGLYKYHGIYFLIPVFEYFLPGTSTAKTLYSSSEKPRAQESFLKIKTLDLEVSKTLERGRAKN